MIPRQARAKRLTLAVFKQNKYGISDEEWKALSQKCKQRDGYKCRKCPCQDRFKLQAHHIVPRTRGGPNALSNLITLCVDCHTKEHPHMLRQKQRKQR